MKATRELLGARDAYQRAAASTIGTLSAPV
jgi:hypothetical protein